MAESLGHLYHLKSAREFKFEKDRVAFKADYGGESYDCLVSFAGALNLSLFSVVSGSIVLSGGSPLWIRNAHRTQMLPGDFPAKAHFDSSDSAMMFVDALLTLKKSVLVPETEEADFTAFTVSARKWLAATPKPEMPDDARAYKALAEDVFERKDVSGALDAYCKALDKYPMWRKGQYNAAILAAEAEDYELAAHHMRRYLVLSPDAKDAQASKDKLLLWQLKAKE